jgi:hypothetical protein
MKRFEKFEDFLNEKKKASAAQIAARKNFAEKFGNKKKEAETTEENE